eukprot:1917133-Rhodomonas_salina.1
MMPGARSPYGERHDRPCDACHPQKVALTTHTHACTQLRTNQLQEASWLIRIALAKQYAGAIQCPESRSAIPQACACGVRSHEAALRWAMRTGRSLPGAS